MKWLYELHEGLPRQGPGDIRSTHKAYTFLKKLPPLPKILDMGCGPGKQTLDLTKISNGNITALDNHQPYLDELDLRIRSLRLEEHIEIVNGDMKQPDFNDGIFDLIWSEGAIYIIGFDEGLKSWKRLLRPNGYMAVSELSWLKDNRPADLASFWQSAYPAMRSVDENIEVIRSCDYELVEHFTLPETSWWEDYYIPLRMNIQRFKETHKDNDEALAAAHEEEREMDLYEEYPDVYGYVFYMMQKKQDS